MFNKFGVFINLDYAHQSHGECSRVWNKIMDGMISDGFIFQKRVFVIHTDKSRDEVSNDVRNLFDSIQKEQGHFYSYISDSYILNLKDCSDLTLPDTSNTIDVENITFQELNSMGIDYDSLIKK
ncbi:MAG: hypothetical protein KZQ64_06870 [gamma proteobacterium symbiont of Bathyaustriella thionipta]|nr:hypothetical protein [gamma proteobacterium symbiont of Bathyaustriella thionipta]MCU7949706.1 hypothetical protein [gamma proteobacterium symbiont of Bathyaustriella thionipta]MCU7953096.1 hypothetical protein [gamma proteobacterium symbiont of Bathyaustriella thionipta]MCU7956286.1 hypothetical protein [gamma proteobacterium symbiont of Bathyaustriella thionipta]MCU7967648.1 hypothetical protein [gamma proteobacterium symbiont of Bathyaustriella thionipta]